VFTGDTSLHPMMWWGFIFRAQFTSFMNIIFPFLEQKSGDGLSFLVLDLVRITLAHSHYSTKIQSFCNNQYEEILSELFRFNIWWEWFCCSFSFFFQYLI
jgi:uncharacterized membrane protein